MNIFKDIITSLLIVICLIFTILAIFYEDISIGKVIPEDINYELPEEIKKEIEETNLEGTEEVIVNYYIDGTDLKKYEKANEYVKGKSNPFAVISSSIIDGDTSSTIENNNSQNFYEDDGTK